MSERAAKFELHDPSELAATLTLTMTVREWRLFRDQLKTGEGLAYRYPAGDVFTAVRELINAADKHWQVRVEGEES